METAKITLGELKEIYRKAVLKDLTTVFIGDVEVYVSIIHDILNRVMIDSPQEWYDDNMEMEVGKTNIFDER